MNYEIIQAPEFKKKASRAMLTEHDIQLIENEIMVSPERHPVVAGTNGLRKMRYAPESTSGGKRGGVRVCYFTVVSASHIHLITMFSKNEKANLSKDDKRVVGKIIEFIKKSYE